MSILNLMKTKENYPLAGRYRFVIDNNFKHLENGKYLRYDIVDNNNENFATAEGNLQQKASGIRIRTNFKHDYQVNGHISTQDGRLWQITDIMTDQTSVGKESLLFCKNNVNTIYTIGLIEVANTLNVR